VAVEKFLHTISSGYLLASMFVLGISAWYILRKRDESMAKRSILVAAVFGLLSSLMVAYTGDASARTIARVQPVKFASMEALAEGKTNAGLIAIGVLKESERKIGDRALKDFVFKIEIPELLSVLTAGDREAYVPGIMDHVNGNMEKGILSVSEKIGRGKIARNTLMEFQKARTLKEMSRTDSIRNVITDKQFQENYFRYFGYASVDKPQDVIPNINISFYSFHLMVMLGFLFILIFGAALYLLFKGNLSENRWFLRVALLAIPLTYLASELGWVLAEAGRQPWIIQDLMSVSGAVSQIVTGSVVTTFILFAILFSLLLIADISIMLKQIKTGPKH
jgi:cytochrome d ubiquinol oxidase subunit I